jgi:hypothetical protein
VNKDYTRKYLKPYFVYSLFVIDKTATHFLLSLLCHRCCSSCFYCFILSYFPFSSGSMVILFYLYIEIPHTYYLYTTRLFLLLLFCYNVVTSFFGFSFDYEFYYYINGHKWIFLRHGHPLSEEDSCSQILRRAWE